MTTRFLPALVTTLALALPAQALDFSEMTEGERAAFRAEVRAYLMDNPEVIIEAVTVLEQRQAQQQSRDDIALVEANRDALFNDGYSWVGGNPEGDLTLVEFLDYRCGYCRRAFPEVQELIESDGNIRMIVKEFPILGAESTYAARFAIAAKLVAGDEAYQAFHETLMSFNGAVDETSIGRIASSLGMDSKPILAQMESEEVNRVIAENHQLAQRLDITGTPSFVMGNRMLRGYVPVADMRSLAEEIRAQ